MSTPQDDPHFSEKPIPSPTPSAEGGPTDTSPMFDVESFRKRALWSTRLTLVIVGVVLIGYFVYQIQQLNEWNRILRPIAPQKLNIERNALQFEVHRLVFVGQIGLGVVLLIFAALAHLRPVVFCSLGLGVLGISAIVSYLFPFSPLFMELILMALLAMILVNGLRSAINYERSR